MKKSKKKLEDDLIFSDEVELTEEEKELKLHPSEEQGILPEEDEDTLKAKMEHQEIDEDIYSNEGLEKLGEEGEIEPWEEGFMQGATGAGQLGKDALTGEEIIDMDEVVELKIKGKLYRFANEENAEEFKKKKKKEKLKQS